METALLVEQGVLAAIAQLVPLISQAYQAAQAQDQATLDAIMRQVSATSDALKPEGGDPTVDPI